MLRQTRFESSSRSCLALAVGFTSLLLTIGCIGGGPDDGADTATMTSEGGLVQSPDGLMELAFPAGAVSEPTAITIEVVDDAAMQKLVSAIYRLSPSGIEFGAPVVARLSVPNVNPTGWVVLANVDNPTPVAGEASKYLPEDAIVQASLRHFSSYAAVDEPCAGAWIDGDGSCRRPDSTSYPDTCCDGVIQCFWPYTDTCPEGQDWECVCPVGDVCDFGTCQPACGS